MDDATNVCFGISISALILAALTPIVLMLVFGRTWDEALFLCHISFLKWVIVGFVAVGLLASVLSNVFAIIYLCLERWDISIDIETFVIFVIGLAVTGISTAGLVYLIQW